MCIDYTNIRACPKDNLPLPRLTSYFMLRRDTNSRPSSILSQGTIRFACIRLTKTIRLSSPTDVYTVGQWCYSDSRIWGGGGLLTISQPDVRQTHWEDNGSLRRWHDRKQQERKPTCSKNDQGIQFSQRLQNEANLAKCAKCPAWH